MTVPTKMLIALLALLLSLLGSASFLRCRRKRGSSRHRAFRKRAVKVYGKIAEGNLSDGQVLAYLRKINPYVFEELVLDSFERHGFKAIRNERYSGDGGIDGKVMKGGETYLVQCKRYKGYVKPGHVEEFARICEAYGGRGYFIHTGRTGRKSKNRAYYGAVEVVSGNKLIKLIKYYANK